MPTRPVVAILIVAYNAREDLGDCLDAVLAGDDGPIDRRVVVVDNASTDGSGELVAERYPSVMGVRSDHNRGFAGGNNLGWRAICETWGDVDYLVLLNPDTVVEPGWLGPMLEVLADDPAVGIAQAKLRLHPQTECLNSAGNRSHFLGFGFVTGCGQVDEGQYDRVREIDFASGCACMIRASVLAELGLFEDEMFLYLEDADLSWKVRQAGGRVVYVPSSVVYHKYSFDKNLGFYFYFERNRWLLLLTYYKAATLGLIAPAAALMELGQLLFAWRNGVAGQKLRSWSWFLRADRLSWVLRRRRDAQCRRVIGDREFLGGFAGAIEHQAVDGLVLRYLANPVLGGYWRLVRWLIAW
jgi:hypothetical protein